jgi:hypothetical protein
MAAFIPDMGSAADMPVATAAVTRVAADFQERVPAAVSTVVSMEAVAEAMGVADQVSDSTAAVDSMAVAEAMVVAVIAKGHAVE